MRQAMAWRLTGQARIARIAASGRAQHLTLVGGILPMVMLWQGLVLLPGSTEPAPAFALVLGQVLPLTLWGALVMVAGALQGGGYTLAYLGLMQPLRRTRIAVASIVVGYFVLAGMALVFSGFTYGAAAHFALALLGARDLTNAADAD